MGHHILLEQEDRRLILLNTARSIVSVAGEVKVNGAIAGYRATVGR